MKYDIHKAIAINQLSIALIHDIAQILIELKEFYIKFQFSFWLPFSNILWLILNFHVVNINSD